MHFAAASVFVQFGFAHAKPTVAHYDINFFTFVDLVSNMSSALINAQPLDGFNCR